MSENAPSPAPRFSVRSVQLVRAGFAALAAIMITFSSDHSANLGLTVFSGFAVATGLVFLISAWLTYPADRRGPAIGLGIVAILAGMAAGVAPWQTTLALFIVFIAWGALSGLIELIWGLRERRRAEVSRADARDTITAGVLGLLLAVSVAVVPAGYSLTYFIPEADQSFVLTGTIIAVGLFGAYAAILAVLMAIAAFSPRAEPAQSAPAPVDKEHA